MVESLELASAKEGLKLAPLADLIGYVDAGMLKLDLRTVSPSQDDALIGAIIAAARQK